jgi:hypothetical protein
MVKISNIDPKSSGIVGFFHIHGRPLLKAVSYAPNCLETRPRSGA